MSWSRRPGRMTAGSRMSGRLVAPITNTFLRAPTPSISVRIWLITRSPTSLPPAEPDPRALAMESISSKKMTQGAAWRALSNRLRTLASDSPNHMVRSSGPLTEMKLDWHSLAMALAMSVLPQPEGPYRSTPLEADMPNLPNLPSKRMGNWMVSMSSFLMWSRPPTSAQVTSVGTSAVASRSELGWMRERAALMCSGRTVMACSTSASTSSVSMSTLAATVSRTAAMAESVASCARSAPQKPCVSSAIWSTDTDSCSFMPARWILSTSRRPGVSGTPMSTSRSKRPKRRRAGSMVAGRLVAATRMRGVVGLIESMRVSSWLTMRFSASPWALSRRGATASSSSMKRMAGAFSLHSAKALRRLASDSPAWRDITSGPLIVKVKAPDSARTALAIMVFPQPGAPWMRRPRGGEAPTSVKSLGWRMGSSTISRICASCCAQPPMSS
mmetsp:Transcript_10065/g.34221  ORF Transcript_10065/g.34221 Transcript_10065/m.34221 type:complete len:443 (+) Transcript_10065:574-1902(+)